uniref:Zinc finger protein 782 n=3 Tax=Culex pipiens TaxID=7175 RepID=A0A8D8DUT7_CULPI
MEVCRTCMSERSVQLVPVYSKLDDAFIANIIMECTSIQIRENDGLPAHICFQCMETLRLLSAFIKTARDCDRTLRKLCKTDESGPSVNPILLPGSSKAEFSSLLGADDTDVFQFAEVKIEPSDELLAEGVESEESSDDDDGRASGVDSDSDSSESDSNTATESDWEGSEEEVVPRRIKKEPREGKRRGRKPKPRSYDSDDRPMLNKRKPKYDEDLEMNDFERELYNEINVEDGKRICCGCLLIFETDQELESHRAKVHTRKREGRASKKEDTRVHCDGCLRKYKSTRRVNYHKERIRQLEVIWECKKCRNRFSEATRRRGHAKKHPAKMVATAIMAPIKEDIQQELGWICCAQACAQSFPDEATLMAHALKAHQINKQEAEIEGSQDKTVQCMICYRRFHDKNGLINHQQRLYRLNKYQCALCGLQFSSGGRLTEHELTHGNEKPFKCDVCGKAFTQKGNLKTHMTVHTNEKPFQCTVCGMSFRQKGGLKTHMSNHIETPQFKCEVCSKLFKAKLHLRYHMRIHNGEKKFPCRYCEKAFTDFTNRMRHEMSHTGIKPYKCSYCEKSFIRKRFLVEHESTHTGIKLYSCEICHQSFGQKNSLKKHQSTAHPGYTNIGGNNTVGGVLSAATTLNTVTNINIGGINVGINVGIPTPGSASVHSIDSASMSPGASSSMPPQTHPIPLTSHQQQQLMAVFHQQQQHQQHQQQLPHPHQ